MLRKIGLLIIAALIMVACGKDTSAITAGPPDVFTKAYKEIDAVSAPQLKELRTLVGDHNSTVMKLAYNTETNRIYAIYKGGDLLGWDVNTSTVVIHHSIRVASTNGLEFDGSGAKVLAAGKDFWASIHNEQIELISQIAIWDVSTGKQVQCLSFSCDPSRDPVRDTANPEWRTSAGLDSAGRWEFDYSDNNIFILDLANRTGAQSIAVEPSGANYSGRIGRIAFDDAHQRYAIIYREGRIVLSPVNHAGLAGISLDNHTVAAGNQNDAQTVLAAGFDPTGKWLAVDRGGELSMWRVDDNKEYVISQDASNLVALNFDRTGKLLFIVTPNQLEIWNVESQTSITKIETRDTSTLSISQDNRLLISGDLEGAIHIWAVPATPQ